MSSVAPKVGDPAPPFTAEGTGGRKYSLGEYAGQSIVLVFYPGDATPVCTLQLNAYNEGFGRLTELSANVLALSPQDVASHEQFSVAHGFNFPLLYDKDKAIGVQYGVVGPLGFYRRSVFVVDGDGFLRYANRAMAGLSYPSLDEITQVLQTLY